MFLVKSFLCYNTNMISIDKSYEDLLVINKSKFYAFVYPITTEDEAREYINNLRLEYKDATHICTAFMLSSPKVEKSDDDGEPSGTAGKPMLELLKKRGLDNVLLAVVRYFGGVKLGAGGLVRAYTNAGNLVLNKANIVSIEKVDVYKGVIDILFGTKVMDSIRSMNGEVLNCKYTDKVEFDFIGVDINKLKSIFPNMQIEIVGSKVVCQK